MDILMDISREYSIPLMSLVGLCGLFWFFSKGISSAVNLELAKTLEAHKWSIQSEISKLESELNEEVGKNLQNHQKSIQEELNKQLAEYQRSVTAYSILKPKTVEKNEKLYYHCVRCYHKLKNTAFYKNNMIIKEDRDRILHILEGYGKDDLYILEAINAIKNNDPKAQELLDLAKFLSKYRDYDEALVSFREYLYENEIFLDDSILSKAKIFEKELIELTDYTYFKGTQKDLFKVKLILETQYKEIDAYLGDKFNSLESILYDLKAEIKKNILETPM